MTIVGMYVHMYFNKVQHSEANKVTSRQKPAAEKAS